MGSGVPLSGRAELVRLELDDHNYLAGPAASVASFLKMGRGQSPDMLFREIKYIIYPTLIIF